MTNDVSTSRQRIIDILRTATLVAVNTARSMERVDMKRHTNVKMGKGSDYFCASVVEETEDVTHTP